MKKICSKCGVEKDYSEFYKDKRVLTGTYSSCKSCHGSYKEKSYKNGGRERHREFYRRIENKLTVMYFYVVQRNDKFLSLQRKGFEPLQYGRTEFMEYMMKNTEYRKVHIRWAESGYKYKLCPTADRIDNEKGYQLENIQCISFIENLIKEHETLGHNVEKAMIENRELLVR